MWSRLNYPGVWKWGAGFWGRQWGNFSCCVSCSHIRATTLLTLLTTSICSLDRCVWSERQAAFQQQTAQAQQLLFFCLCPPPSHLQVLILGVSVLNFSRPLLTPLCPLLFPLGLPCPVHIKLVIDRFSLFMLCLKWNSMQGFEGKHYCHSFCDKLSSVNVSVTMFIILWSIVLCARPCVSM